MRTRLEAFQRLDSRFRGNELNSPDDRPQQPSLTQPYPKLGLEEDMLYLRSYTGLTAFQQSSYLLRV